MIGYQAGELYQDGSVQNATVNYAYRFDAIVTSPCRKYIVLYEKLGTKGLVFHKVKFCERLIEVLSCS